MIILKTIAHETIWGGEKLVPYCDIETDHLGHLYSLHHDHEGSNLILNGPYQGRKFGDWFQENKEKYGLGGYAYFPLIIALVEAKESLSIQVHPDDRTAEMLCGNTGKNESWYFIETPHSGSIYCGCACNDLEEVRKNMLENNMEAVTERLPVVEGDYVYIVSGTLHAMAAGSLVYEIEENAGATFRFYDFDRIDDKGNRRELHPAQALMSIKPENRIETGRYEGSDPINERKYLTRHFDRLDHYANESHTLQVLTILSGKVDVDGIECVKGQSIILLPKEEMDMQGCEIMLAQPKELKE